MAIRSLLRTGQFQEALDMINEMPNMCKVKDTPAANYILHEACLHKAPVYLVEKLLSVHPVAASSKDRAGLTPLDHALATPGTPNGVLELLLVLNPKHCSKAVDGVLTKSASRRRKKERRRSLDALPSLGSKPEGMVMVDLTKEADALTALLNSSTDEKASPLKPLATSPSTPSPAAAAAAVSAASSPGESIGISPTPKPVMKRRSSFSQMIKSLFVSEASSWRGGQEDKKDWSDAIDIDAILSPDKKKLEQVFAAERRLNFKDAMANASNTRGLDLKNGGVDFGDAPVDVLAAMASIHAANGYGGEKEKVGEGFVRVNRDKRRNRRSY
jgi:pentatricopeptide repeat protein